jgi:hypothetical protein
VVVVERGEKQAKRSAFGLCGGVNQGHVKVPAQAQGSAAARRLEAWGLGNLPNRHRHVPVPAACRSRLAGL